MNIKYKSLFLSVSVISISITATPSISFAQTCYGTQSRAVTCRDHKGNTVPDAICNGLSQVGVQPPPIQTCTYTCPPPPPIVQASPPPPVVAASPPPSSSGADPRSSTGPTSSPPTYHAPIPPVVAVSPPTYHAPIPPVVAVSPPVVVTPVVVPPTIEDTSNGGDGDVGGHEHGNSAGDGGGGDGDSVLCGHFYQRQMISYATYKGDLEFAKANFDYKTQRGYRFWAVPLTKHLNENPNGIAEKVMHPIVVSWAQEMAYRSGYHDKGHWLGKLQLTFSKPVINLVGLFVKDKNCSHLSSEQAIGAEKCQFLNDPTAMMKDA